LYSSEHANLLHNCASCNFARYCSKSCQVCLVFFVVVEYKMKCLNRKSIGQSINSNVPYWHHRRSPKVCEIWQMRAWFWDSVSLCNICKIMLLQWREWSAWLHVSIYINEIVTTTFLILDEEARKKCSKYRFAAHLVHQVLTTLSENIKRDTIMKTFETCLRTFDIAFDEKTINKSLTKLFSRILSIVGFIYLFFLVVCYFID
jgi:hypothetical protein